MEKRKDERRNGLSSRENPLYKDLEIRRGREETMNMMYSDSTIYYCEVTWDKHTHEERALP